MANETDKKTPVSKFTKEQILKSVKYQDQRDCLSVLLKNDKQYSHAEIETLIDGFMKGTVKK